MLLLTDKLECISVLQEEAELTALQLPVLLLCVKLPMAIGISAFFDLSFTLSPLLSSIRGLVSCLTGRFARDTTTLALLDDIAFALPVSIVGLVSLFTDRFVCERTTLALSDNIAGDVGDNRTECGCGRVATGAVLTVLLSSTPVNNNLASATTG